MTPFCFAPVLILRLLSPAPIFTFAVDGVVKWDQSSAKVTTAAGANTYEWDHPTNGAFGHHQLLDLLLKVLIIAGETYDYTIQKLDAAGSPTKQLEETMSGAGFWRSDFNLGVR